MVHPSSPNPPPVCLAVGGSDPSGGAGIQADLKVFHGHGVYGAAAPTLLTVQNTRGVRLSRVLEPEFVADQMEAVLSDLPVAAVKTGALGNGKVAAAVARALEGWSGILVVDPVVAPKSGAALSDLGSLDGFRPLFARADVLAPNLDEASLLLGRRIVSEEEMPGAAEDLRGRFGCRAVLLKGGHLPGPVTADLLLSEEGVRTWRSERIPSGHTHGTGCALASSLTSRLALGRPLPVAAREAREWLRKAIAGAPGLGAGNGPLDLFA